MMKSSHIKMYYIKYIFIPLYILLYFKAGFSQCPVVPAFSFSQTCGTGTFQFTDLSTATSGSITGWYWDFDDGANSANQNPAHTFTLGNTYDVMLTVTHSTGCTAQVSHSIIASTAPVADFSFAPDNVCSETLINFISNSSGSNISYSWNFGDGNTSTQQNPSHIFYAYGSGSQIFNVTLTVTDVNHCTASKTKPVTIIKGPQVLYYETNNFKTCLTSYGTVSETAEIINASPDSLTIASYTINWGDGSGTSPILLPFHAVSHTYTALGSYPITIIATGNNGCKTTFTGNYIIEAYPSASVQGAPGTPIQGCTPLTINVINNSTNITPSTLTTIYWGDGLLPTILPLGSSGGTISYTYTTSSCDNGSQDPFLIELKVQNACGTTSSYWGPITVYAAPQSNFIASDTLSCTGTNITFTNQSIANLCAGNPATYFTWNFGDGIVIGPATGLSSMNHSYSNPGTYIVSLTAENNSANGCGSTTSNLAIVIGELAADFISDTACFGSATSFFDISTSSNGTIQSWDWSFNDDGIPWWNFWDNSSSLQNPTHAYTHPGQFSVELTVTDNNGCEKTISKNVVVDYLPVANFNWDPFCSGSTVQFHDLSAGINADIESWSWNFGDGATSLQQNPIHLYSSTGLFNVTLTVTDEHGCTDNIVQQVEAGTNPVANFIYTSACAGQPVQFNDISNAPDAEIVSWLWNFGDASTSPAQNPEHTYSSTGSYNVNLIITDENNCTDDTTIAVVLNNSPSAMFSSNQVCFGLPTSFIDASSGPSDIVAWSWNFGDGGSSSLQNPAHIYNEQENFTASLVVTDENGCIDTVFQNVLIDSIPHVDFTFDPFCFGQETQFINNSYPTGGATIISWNWSFGDSGTSTAETPVHTYATAATFNVTLTATDSKGCSSIITEQVTVFPEPLADFEAVTACSGTQTVFTDESTSAAGNITSWQWNFGDGNTSSQQAPTHTYSTPGTYNVQLIVSDINGCYDTIIKEVNSVFTIIADFIAVNVCQGTTTCFTDISYSSGGGITSWSWHFNDPNVPWYMPWLNSSGSQNPCHEFTQAGNYTIDLDIEDESGCTGSVSKTIVIYDGPTANFSASSSSLGEPTIFTDQSASGTGSITSWSWNFSDGSPVSPMQNPEYTYAIAGTYNVTLTITDSNGCTSSITKQITVIDLPHADFSATMVCFGETTIFTDQSTSPGGQITGWQWNFDDGNTSAVQNPSHLYSSPGIYNVQLIANDINGVFDTVVKPVTVYPLPVADFIYDTVCDGGTTHFYDQSSVQSENIASWSWSFNDDGIPWWNFWGNSSSDQNPTHDYTHNGIFSVQLSVEDNNGCFDTVVQNIFVNDPPVAEFNSEPTVLGDPSVFTDLSTPGSGIINSWYWNFGDGNTSTAQAPVHTYSLPGTYVVSLTVTDNFGCTSTITHNHLVYDGPVPDFTYTNVCFGETTHFEDQSVSPGVSFVAWNWDFGDGGTSSQQNPDHYYSSAGTFTVQLIVTDENDLNDTVIKNVIIYSLPDPDFTWYNTCEGDTAFFNDLSSGDIVSWSWNFGDILSPANTSTAQNPLHIFSGTGVYSVQLLVENEYGCINSVVHNITVSQNPIAGFNATTAILGAPTLFTDTSVPGNGTIEQWYWNFGDGGTSVVQSPTHYYNSAETYFVQLIVTDNNGISDTLNSPVTIHQPPFVDFISDTACFGESTHFNDLSTDAAIWLWNFGSGYYSSVQNPYHHFLSSGIFPVSLQIIDIFGCENAAIHNVVVSPSPIAEFYWDTVCPGFEISFTDLSFDSLGISFWSWNYGDNFESSIQNPQHIYSYGGSYNVSLTVTNTSNCSTTKTHSVFVILPPNADFYASSINFGNPTGFTDISGSPNGNIISWQWDFGDSAGTSALQNPSYTYSASGVFYTTLIVIDIIGCTDTVTKLVIVYSPTDLTAAFTASSVCAGSSTMFTDISYSQSGTIISWVWEFGDGGTATSQHPYHNYANPGTYAVQLTVTDNQGNSDSIIQNIVVLLPPAANFISNTVILGNPTSFTDISTGGGAGIISWLWNFGDGTAFSTIQNPVHTYSLYGQYSVTLTVTNSFGCSNSFTGQTLVVSQTSVTAAFTANDACNGQSAMFFDQSFSPNGSIASWYWNFDDSQTSSLQNPNHIYLNPGTYSVMLIAGDVLNNSDTCIHQITIFPVPSVNFTYNSDCFTNVVHFTNTSTISSGFISQCQWNFGDGNTAYICELQHAYSGFGAYNVTLAVISNLGCSSSLVHSIVVTPNPTANFHSQPNCVGYLTYFSDSSEVEYGIINNWHWEFGDGDTSALQNPEHTYNSAGDYDVLLIVSTNSGCLDTILRTVSINFAPHAGFNSMNACVLKDAQFTDLSTIAYGNITSWLWLFGDDSIAELQNPVHQYAFSGTFNVTLITTSNLGCMDTISAPVTVYPSPEIYFTSTTECMNSKTQFTNQTQISSGSVTSWNWDFDDGTFSSLQNPLHTFSGAETYSVTLNAISNFGCTGSHAENVNVYALPSANFYYNDACQGNITNFTDSSSIDNDIIGSWLWNFGDGASTILQNPNHLYFSEGIYIVKLKVSTLNGCSDSVAKVVHVYPAPVAYFTHEIACENHGTMFYNASTISSGSIITWNWNFGDLNADTAEAPVHTYLSAGSFLAILEVTAQNECTASYSDTIIVYPSPQIALDDDTILCGNDTKILDAGNPGAIYLWSSGANTQTIIAHEGDGKIWVIVEQNNCSATDTINILECNQNIVDVPTAFSPNNDGNNDVLYVYGNNIAELEFLIFNRFGELVFESHNQNHGWNGTRNEKQCEIEVYVYYLKCKFINGTIITKGGNVSLVK